MTEPQVRSIDGFVRGEETERRINTAFANCFGGISGPDVLTYLRRITVLNVQRPGISSEALWHLEGQRYLVGLIEERIEHGRRPESQPQFKPEPRRRSAARRDTA
jgi:hypothetical protein